MQDGGLSLGFVCSRVCPQSGESLHYQELSWQRSKILKSIWFDILGINSGFNISPLPSGHAFSCVFLGKSLNLSASVSYAASLTGGA